MKQHITVEQLNELSEKGKDNLRKWWKPGDGDHCYSLRDSYKGIYMYDFIVQGVGYDDNDFLRFWKDQCLPLLSIGQMIEFLDEEEAGTGGGANYIDIHYGDENTWREVGPITLWDEVHKEDLCDALWEAVKEVLEN